MINFEALFKVTYGLYIVSSGDRRTGNGFISNTVFQVTAEPPRFASCCNKNNFTDGLIEKHGFFSVSVLDHKTSPEIFGKFGYKSGKDLNKFEGMDIKYGETGVPIVMNNAIAILECRVVQKFDVWTHNLYIGELVDARIVNETAEPITYAYYRQVRKGYAAPNAPTYIDKSKLEKKTVPEKSRVYKCSACGYIYDENMEGIRFSDLPENWTCPVCGSEKEFFNEV
jgi:flavin reductase (DIM6/NTAB) family NADH-FMN oxidoreductase RutF/rubredoxin